MGHILTRTKNAENTTLRRAIPCRFFLYSVYITKHADSPFTRNECGQEVLLWTNKYKPSRPPSTRTTFYRQLSTNRFAI